MQAAPDPCVADFPDELFERGKVMRGPRQHGVQVYVNAAAGDIPLSPEDLALLDAAFPGPTHKVPLDIL